jgi:fused signal recognition particle receptor
VVGVNGSGKTTFIGKLAYQFRQQGHRVLIGAGDTFRAAAEDQLAVWAERAGAEIIRADEAASGGADPAAVIFDTLKRARDEGVEVVLLDTAGRLQNKFNLMEEMKKIRRIIDRERPEDSVLEALLVLDATTGQNALKQAKAFQETVDLTGVVLTKLDSSAKGGVVLAVAKEYRLPVKMVGVGEGIEDLQPFETDAFIDGLLDRD